MIKEKIILFNKKKARSKNVFGICEVASIEYRFGRC